MRAISPHANYSIPIRNPRPRRGTDSTGTVVEYTDGEPLLAQFSKTGLLDHEIEEALEHFGAVFGALPEGVNPITRVAAFDTEAFVENLILTGAIREDERKAVNEEVESRLRKAAELFPTQLRIVEQPAAPKPWAAYDEQSVEDIIKLQAATGISPEAIRLYELENKARTSLIAAMEELESGGTDTTDASL